MIENIGLTETQLAYIAGFIDGEGTFVVGKYSRSGNRYLAYRGFCAIANTHVPVLQSIQKLLGGKIIEQGIGRQCFSLSFTTNEIRRWLPDLQQFLIVKKEQAEVLMAFLDKQADNASAPISEELLSFYESCYLKLKKLKKVRFSFKEKVVTLGIRKCRQCGNEFEANSKSPKKTYCSVKCKKIVHYTRSNRRISLGIPAWNNKA